MSKDEKIARDVVILSRINTGESVAALALSTGFAAKTIYRILKKHKVGSTGRDMRGKYGDPQMRAIRWLKNQRNWSNGTIAEALSISEALVATRLREK